jgi:hypothetical protein
MVFSQKPESELIAEALAAGHLSVPDEHGFHHELYAICPRDGLHLAPVRTIWKRDATGRHIDHLEFRCLSCGHTWQAEQAELHLR